MASEAKKIAVTMLNEKFAKSKGVVVTQYRGLTALEMGDLRNQLRGEGVELCVAKNTLARLAAEGTPVEKAIGFFNGPTSIALCYKDLAPPAKIITEFVKKTPNLKIIGGVIGGEKLTENQVKIVADLPPRKVLLSRVLATMNAPASGFAGVLAAVIRKFLFALKEIEKKKEDG